MDRLKYKGMDWLKTSLTVHTIFRLQHSVRFILFLNKVWSSFLKCTTLELRHKANRHAAGKLAVVVGSFEKKRTFTAKASTEFIIQIDWRPHCPLTKAGGLSVHTAWRFIWWRDTWTISQGKRFLRLQEAATTYYTTTLTGPWKDLKIWEGWV